MGLRRGMNILLTHARLLCQPHDCKCIRHLLHPDARDKGDVTSEGRIINVQDRPTNVWHPSVTTADTYTELLVQ
jgi:hypothetical protein